MPGGVLPVPLTGRTTVFA